MVATPTSSYRHSNNNMPNSFSSTQHRNSFDDQKQRGGGVQQYSSRTASPSRNTGSGGGGTYRGFSGGNGHVGNSPGGGGRRLYNHTGSSSSGEPMAESQHFFPSQAASPRNGRTDSRGAKIVTNVNHRINHPVHSSSSKIMVGRDQLAHQKDQWNVERDIPSGTVRNNPFLPQPKPQPPQPVQLVHQKKQWDTSNIPLGSVAARAQVMELESPRNKGNNKTNGTSRLSGGSGTWQPQPIPINLDKASSTSNANNNDNNNINMRLDNEKVNSITNVTSHSSSMRGRMIETGGARLQHDHQHPINAATNPRWEPSREIPKGTVKGRTTTLFGAEDGERESASVNSSSVGGTRGYKNFIAPSDGRGSNAAVAPRSNKDTTKQRRQQQNDDDEDPWIIPNKTDSARGAYRGQDWGEGAVVSATSAESDDWDAPTKEWLQSESQSSEEEDLFHEARPAKKTGAGATAGRIPSRTEYEGPKEDKHYRSSETRDARTDDRIVSRNVEQAASNGDQQLRSDFLMDRDAEILQAAKQKRASPFSQVEKPRQVQDLPRQVQDLILSRKPALAAPANDVSEYYGQPSPQPKMNGDTVPAPKSTSRVGESSFQPFDDSFTHLSRKEASRTNVLDGLPLTGNDFAPAAFAATATTPSKVTMEHDAYGFPTPTSTARFHARNQEDDEFFDAVASTQYEGPPSLSTSKKNLVSKQSPGTLKPEQNRSRSSTFEEKDYHDDAAEETKKKKKGGFFKGLFGRKGKEKESSKSKKNTKQNRGRPSHGSARDQQSPVSAKSVKSKQSSNRDRSSSRGRGPKADGLREHSRAEKYVEPRSTHVVKGRSEDDTTISEMTNPTVFKEAASNPSPQNSGQTATPHVLSPTLDDVSTPIPSPTKSKASKEVTTPRRGNLVVDIDANDGEDTFVDPELDHLNMDTSEEGETFGNESRITDLEIISSEPPPPPPPKPSQHTSLILKSNISSSRLNRRLRDSCSSNSVVEEKKDEHDSLLMKKSDKQVPTSRRLSGSRYIKKTTSSTSSGEQEEEKKSDTLPAMARKASDSATSTPRNRFRSRSPASRSLNTSSREASPVPEPKRSIRSMNPSPKSKIAPDVKKAPDTMDSRKTSGGISGRYAKKAAFMNNSTPTKPTEVKTVGLTKAHKPAGYPTKQKNVAQEASADITIQSPFARRLAARKSKEVESTSQPANTAKIVPRIPPSASANGRKKEATIRGGSSRYLYPQTGSNDGSDEKRKRDIVTASTSASDEMTTASGSTYDTYQRKLSETLRKSTRGIPSSDHSIRSNYSTTDHSVRSADSSVGSDVRVLKTILRRPRLGNNYDDVIKVSQQNEGFQTYDEKTVTDPMQRVGLRLLSGAIVPIQTEVRRFLATRHALTRMWALIVIQTYARRMLARQQYEDALYAVVTIQRFVRGHNTRVDVINKHGNAIEIQRMVRGYLATVHVYEEIYKVTLVQSWVRMRIAMDDAAYRMALVIQFQAVARGFLQRRRLAHQSAKATVIQTNWRCFYNRLTYQFDLLDIIIVQSLWRRKLGKREAERRLESLRNKSAEVIQTAWRSYDCRMDFICYLAARAIQTKWRSHSCSRNYTEHKAARKIQSVWRSFDCRMDYICYLAARMIQSNWRAAVCREQYLFNIAAKMIQARWRASVCRQDYVAYMAARTIQTNWRSSVCRQDYVQYMGARKIQSNWRASVCRQDYEQYMAARKIQSNWRASICRQDYAEYMAARKIQTNWRSSVCRQDYDQYMAARKIQTSWRASVCRQDYVYYLAATIIQAGYRSSICRKDYVAYMAARTIQTNWRSSVCRQDYAQYMGARKIQTNWRSSLCRQNYVQYMAARKIQTSWRASVCRQDYVYYLAATIIQAGWRSSVCRKAYIASLAARTIQTNWRCSVCRKDYVAYTAAKRIQTNWRSSVCRKDYVAYMAARCIQTSWRASVCREIYLRNIAVKMIQAKWRSSVCRKDYVAYMAARCIQTTWRAYLCRKKFIEYFAATIIQAKWRSFVLRADFQQYRAATKIQSVWRSYDCKMNYLHYLADILIIQSTFRRYQVQKSVTAKKNEAATLIQKSWRAFACFADYEEYKVARKIQSAWRGYVCKAFFKEYTAARKVQAAWRGFVCKAFYREYMAARNIQAVWRGFVCYADYHEFLTVRKIQSNWRGYVRRNAFKRYIAARRIQSLWRGFVQFADFHEYLTVRRVQTAWRGYTCRKAYKRYQAAMTIQTAWRGCLAFADYQEYLAVRRVQRAWRAYSITTKAKEEKAAKTLEARQERAAVTIQCTWRGFVSYADYMFAVADIVAIQKIVRGFVARRNYRRKRANARLHAAVTIQKNWRRFVDETEFVVMKYEYHAARTIQTAWRRFWCFSNYIIALDCSIQIQARVRGYLYRKGFGTRRRAAITVQKVCRQALAKQSAQKLAVIQQVKQVSIEIATNEHTSATKIQRIFRGTMSRTALKVYLSAVKIQSQVRASQARVAVRLYIMSRRIQKTWRGYNPRRAFVTFVAARRIQNKWRSTKACQEAMILRGEKLAATLIQSAWRGFVCYTDYVFTLSDIVSAQRIARGYLSRKQYTPVIRSNMMRKQEEFQAATLLQRTSRGYQARQKYWYALGCTMQIQSWWRGTIAKNAVKRQFEAVTTLQCFARRCLARQQYLQRKFIFMLINTAEKEKIKKTEATDAVQRCVGGKALVDLERERQDDAARIIQSFFLRVKYEVDKLVRAQKRRKKLKKTMMKVTKCPISNVEDSLLEDAWDAAVSRSNLDEEPFTRTFSNMGGSRSLMHMDARSVTSMDHESLMHMETGSIVMAQPVTAPILDPPGSVASSNLRGSTTGSRSLYRRQQEEMRYRLPPTTIQMSNVSNGMRVAHDDDTSVWSQLTGSTMTFARPAHVRVVRRVPVREMEDDFQLEEAFIDAEIYHAKERRQMASSNNNGRGHSSRAPRPTRKSTGGISAVHNSSSRRVSHDGIARTNSRGGDSVTSNGSHKGADAPTGHRRQRSGSRVLTSHGNY